MAWVPDGSGGMYWQDDTTGGATPNQPTTPPPGGAAPPPGSLLGTSAYQNVGGLSYNVQTGQYFNPATGAQVTDPNQINAAIATSRTSSSNNTSSSTSNSTSYNTSQSLADPAALASQQAIATQGQDAETARNNATIAAQQQTAVMQNNAAIAKANQDYALGQQNLQFLQSKQTYADSVEDQQLKLQTQNQIFTQQQSIAATQLQIVGLNSQRDQINAQIAQQNAAMSNTVQQENITNEANRQQQLASLNSQIATAAADPGDRGKYAALVLANSGYGQQDQALVNANLTSNASLQPLESDLGLRDQLSQPVTPISVAPTAALGALDLSGVTMPTVNTAPYAGIAPTNYGVTLPGAPAPASTANAPAPLNAGVWDAGLGSTAFGGPGATPNTGYTQPTATTGPGAMVTPTGSPPQTLAPAPQSVSGPAASGGVRQTAYLGDENGAEIHIPFTAPDGTPSVYVVKHDIVARMKPGVIKQLKKLADGGVFSGGSVFPGAATDTSAATDFINQSSANARAGTPFATGTLPTPVYASSPGFDPIVTSLLDSLNAQARGTPLGSYGSAASRLAPQGMNAGVVGRSA